MLGLGKIFGRSARSPADQRRLQWEEDHRAFFKAIRKDDLEKITEIVGKYPGEALNWQDNKKKKCVHTAIRDSNVETLHHLIDLGADPNQVCVYQDPTYSMIDSPVNVYALNIALYCNKGDMVYALLERGAQAQRYSSYDFEFKSKRGDINDMLKRADKIRANYLKHKETEGKPPEPKPEPPPKPAQKKPAPAAPAKPEKPPVDPLEFERLKGQLTQALQRIEELERPSVTKLDKPKFQQP